MTTGAEPRASPRLGRLGATAPAAFVVVAFVAAACGPSLVSPSPGGSTGPTPRPSPTPVPTPSASPGPTATGDVGTDSRLVVHVTSCVDVCVPTPGTTILSDARLIWEGPNGLPLVAGLTSAAVDRVSAEMAGYPELATSGYYLAQLRPGAEPFPRGTSTFQFEVGDPDRRIIVTGDPADYALEPDLWIIPPEMERLADLAKRLLDPIAWLGFEAIEEPIQAYVPDRYLVLVELFPGVGSMPEFRVDIDAVESPFGGPFENIGQPVQVDEGGFPVRCLVVDRETARRLAASEAAAGVARDLAAWSSGIAYGWQRGQGFVQLTVRQVLPQQREPCTEVAVT